MMRANNFIVGLVLLAGTSVCSAQKDAQIIYQGNTLYNSGRYPESSAEYAKALATNPNNRKANFNLGSALYRNAQLIKKGDLSSPDKNIPPDSLARMLFDKSAEQFAIVANSVSNKDTLHRSWHNIGNCYLGKKDYAQAVSAYKKALRYDAKDEDTRYNLAYALKHLPPENKNGGGGGGSKPQPKDQQQNQDQKKQPQPQQSEMTKEQAEQLLKAMMETEKKLQDKRKQKQQDPSHYQIEKDW